MEINRRRQEKTYQIIEKFEDFRKGCLALSKQIIQTIQNQYIKADNEISKQTQLNKLEQYIRKVFNQLQNSKQKHHILFFDNLIPDLKDAIIKIIETNFTKLLWEYQRIFLENKKQLLVYRDYQPLRWYLMRYRLPKTYEPKKKQIDKLYEQIKNHIVERNLKISEDLSLDDINTKIQKLNKKIEKLKTQFIDLVYRILKDYKQQEKKERLTFKCVRSQYKNSYLQMIEKNQLFYQEIIIQKHVSYQLQIYKKSRNTFQTEEDDYIQEPRLIKENNIAKEESDDDEYQSQPNKIKYYELLSISYGKADIKFKKPYDNRSPIFIFRVYKKIDDNFIHQFNIENTDIQATQVYATVSGFGYCEFIIKAQNQIGISLEYQIFKIYIPCKKNNNLYILGWNQQYIPNYQSFQSKQDIYTYPTFFVNTLSINTAGLVSDSKGLVAAWGNLYRQNEDPQLQNQQFFQSPVKLTLNFITKVSCGLSFYLFCDALGRVFGFGENQKYQLGLGQNKNKSQAVQIQYFSSNKLFIVDIVASYQHCLALDSNGNAYTWGLNQTEQTQFPVFNRYGQKINFTIHPDKQLTQEVPRRINKQKLNIDRIIKIATGYHVNGIISNKGQLYMWGLNNFGQLGCGKLTNQHKQIFNITIPLSVQAFKPDKLQVTDLKIGLHHCLAIVKNVGNQNSQNLLYSWGNSNKNQCGHGKNIVFEYPKLIQGFLDHNIQIIEVYDEYSIVKTNKGLYSFGNRVFDHQKKESDILKLQYSWVSKIESISAGEVIGFLIKN